MQKKFQDIKNVLTNAFNFNYFLQLTDMITEIVTKEINALKMVQIQQIEEYQGLKQDACQLYSTMIQHLKINQNLLDTLTAEERKTLVEVTENLSRLLTKDEMMIHAFNQTNQRVMEIFREAIESYAHNLYGAKGKKQPPFSTYYHINQRG